MIYSGPLPHPEIIEHFTRVLPTAAERIFSEFEATSSHRRKIESRGQVFGFIASLIILGGAMWLMAHDKPIGGLTSLVIAVGTFIWLQQRRPKRLPQVEKKEEFGPP